MGPKVKQAWNVALHVLHHIFGSSQMQQLATWFNDLGDFI